MDSYNVIYSKRKIRGYGDRSQQIYGARLATYFMMTKVGMPSNLATKLLGLSRYTAYNMEKVLSDNMLFQSYAIEMSFTEMLNEAKGCVIEDNECTYDDLVRMLKIRDEYIKVLENIV